MNDLQKYADIFIRFHDRSVNITASSAGNTNSASQRLQTLEAIVDMSRMNSLKTANTVKHGLRITIC